MHSPVVVMGVLICCYHD